ncbi:hypothetical protein [Methanogenium cariaci]|jgi:hypothetical protein
MRSFTILLCIMALAIIPGQVLASTVHLEAPDTLSFPTAGSTDILMINLTGDGDGLSGYNLGLSMTTPGIVEVASVAYPPWAGMVSNGTIPAENTWIQAVDLQMQVESGDFPVLLTTITLRAIADGETVLTVSPVIVDDDRGGRYALDPIQIPVRVGAVSSKINSPDTDQTRTEALSSSTDFSIVSDTTVSPSVSPIAGTEEITPTMLLPPSSRPLDCSANHPDAFPAQSSPGFGVVPLCLTGFALCVLRLNKLNRGE